MVSFDCRKTHGYERRPEITTTTAAAASATLGGRLTYFELGDMLGRSRAQGLARSSLSRRAAFFGRLLQCNSIAIHPSPHRPGNKKSCDFLFLCVFIVLPW